MVQNDCHEAEVVLNLTIQNEMDEITSMNLDIFTKGLNCTLALKLWKQSFSLAQLAPVFHISIRV